MNRRTFLVSTAAASLATRTSLRAANSASGALRVAVLGQGRGRDHVQALLTLPNVEIAYLAEVDPGHRVRCLRVDAVREGRALRGDHSG